jgi:putative IMPACT (imprinted ancient) family translation regulator
LTHDRIDLASVFNFKITKIITFAYPFDLLPGVRNILQKYTTKILEEKYEENVSMKIEINS